MKKLFVLILTLISAVALIGCGGPDQPADASIAEKNYTVETVENLKAQADDSVLVSFRIFKMLLESLLMNLKNNIHQ